MSLAGIFSAKPHPSPAKSFDEEERRQLLATNDIPDVEPQLAKDDALDAQEQKTSPKRKVVCIAVGLIALLAIGTIAPAFLCCRPSSRTRSSTAFSGPVQSNGTHFFKPTVLMVSIDGLRADYLDRGLTPHLLELSKKGLRAKSMKPIFPTLTFPNHWALMTGLHAESHGIVANTFWDPVSRRDFHYNQVASAWISDWWLGEPLWETAEKAGVVTANLMWPGPPKTTAGGSSKYFVPWKDKVSLDIKLSQLLNWIDLPDESRPQLLLAYEPSLDQAGHATGPYSQRINDTLVQVDLFAKNLHDQLALRNLTDIVDVVFVSDHGMTDTSHPELFYMDDVLGEQGLADIEHNDGWPSMGLRFRRGANVTQHLQALLDAAERNPEKFDVYTHETMPERYHFSHSERISPIYVVPKIGYVLTTKDEGDVGMSKGNHGYDNDEPSMHAIFVAHGPFSIKAKVQHQQRALVSRDATADGWHSTSNDEYIMKTFPNVEIYNLIMELLHITDFAAPTNGTEGFWKQYL